MEVLAGLGSLNDSFLLLPFRVAVPLCYGSLVPLPVPAASV